MERIIEQIIRCERSILLRILEQPEEVRQYWEYIETMEFADEHSYTLWEAIRRMGQIPKLTAMELLQHVAPNPVIIQMFSGLIGYSIADNVRHAALNELILHHWILAEKACMNVIRAKMVNTDEVEQSYLWERYSLMLKGVKAAELKLRAQATQKEQNAEDVLQFLKESPASAIHDSLRYIKKSAGQSEDEAESKDYLNSELEKTFYENWTKKLRDAGYTVKHNEKIGPYYVDVILPDCGIVIELDGFQWHGQQQKSKWQKDYERSRYIQRKGYVILRYTYNDISGKSPVDVIDDIQSISKAV